MRNFPRRVSRVILKKVFFPILIFSVLVGGYGFYRVNIVPLISSEIRGEVRKYILSLFVISISFILQRVIGAVSLWYKENIASRTETRLDEEFIPLLRRSCKIGLWVIAILMILPIFGININALIATLGVSSLAIALAAQDTIANIIAGFMIMVDRPFRIGDKIKLPSGEVVTVLDIGVRRTRFLAEDKSIMIMPNLELSKSKIVNYTYGEEFRRS